MSKSSEKAQQFLSLGALVALVILPQGCERRAAGDPEVEIHRQALTVTNATFDAWVDYQDVYGPEEFHGDTFQTAWSDDGNLYLAADDSWIPTWNYNNHKGANIRMVRIGEHSVTSWTTPPTMTFADVNTTSKSYGGAGERIPHQSGNCAARYHPLSCIQNGFDSRTRCHSLPSKAKRGCAFSCQIHDTTSVI